MTKKYILGIDGGGTRTTAVLADLEGKVFQEYITGSSNYKSVGIKNVQDNINSAVLGVVGTYQVDGPDVVFSAEAQDYYGDAIVLNATGTIADNNNMQGTFSYYYTLFPLVNLRLKHIFDRFFSIPS